MPETTQKYDKHELFLFVLSLEDSTHRNWIGGAIMRRFGEKLEDDELEFVVVHVDGPVASRAAEILLERSADSRVLGVIAKYCPEFEMKAWEKVQGLFSTKDTFIGREIFLGFCPRLRAEVRQAEFDRKYYHLK